MKDLRNLCIAFVTSRKHCEGDWFYDSLRVQIGSMVPSFVVIDSNADFESQLLLGVDGRLRLRKLPPKPNIWQGKHRVTSQDWWAVSNARNTAICVCPPETDYIVFLDDRSVLMSSWLRGVERAMREQYAVCGSYEKRTGMKVENGVIMHGGIITGRDQRQTNMGVLNVHGQFWGGTMGCPLEWALNVNGFEEMVDGLGAEDYLFGMMLRNNHYPTKFDPEIKIVQDRTPELLGEAMKKTDKGVSPRDKSHAALERFGRARRAENFGKDLRAVRERFLRGEEFEIPDPTTEWRDWFDGQLIREMT